MICILKNHRCLADATYKILVEGFPVLTVGTTDQNRAFHPFGLGIVSHETWEDFKFLFDSIQKASKQCSIEAYRPTLLIADNAEAIQNGFIACKNCCLIDWCC